MAEQVQESLDLMVPALNDWEERGIFSQVEIVSIVGRRRQSEYLLHRHAANIRKSDFLTYIQDEILLEQLRSLRTKRIRKEKLKQLREDERRKHQLQAVDGNQHSNDNNEARSNDNIDKVLKGVGDYHIIAHIHSLYKRLLTRFKDDVSLYMQYAEFCKQHKSYQKLSRCYAECLQYHPTSAIQVWIDCASHEYFHNNSIHNARILFQRAIRVNTRTDSPNTNVSDLWVQLFTLELHFVQKMKGRKKILFSQSHKKSDQMVCEDKSEARVMNLDVDLNAQKLPDCQTSDQHIIARVVYDNAIKAVTGLKVRLQFLDQCKLFPDTSDLQAYIIKSIEDDSTTPQAYIARAMYYASLKKAAHIRNSGSVIQQSTEDNEVIHSIEDDNLQNQPMTKKQRITTITDPIQISAFVSTDPVLDIIRKGCLTLQTADMFTQGIRFLLSYEEEIATDDTFQSSKHFNFVHWKNIIDDLFDIAASKRYLQCSNLLLEHVNFYRKYTHDEPDLQQKFVDKCFSCFVDNETGPVDHFMWISWAESNITYSLRQNDVSGSTLAYTGAIQILNRGLRTYSMHDSSYFILLMQLFSVTILSLSHDTDDKNELSFDLLQQIILLAPGFILHESNMTALDDMEHQFTADCPFLITNIMIVFAKSLMYLTAIKHVNISFIRKLYEMVLFKSSVVDKLLLKNEKEMTKEIIKKFVDDCISAEYKFGDGVRNEMSIVTTKQLTELPKRIQRLFVRSIEIFAPIDKKIMKHYKQRHNDEIVYGTKQSNIKMLRPSTLKQQNILEQRQGTMDLKHILSFDVTCSSFHSSHAIQAYKDFQVVHLRNVGNASGIKENDTILSWANIGKVFDELNSEDKDSWCVETKGEKPISPSFLHTSPCSMIDSEQRAYCSFIIQKDVEMYNQTLQQLPFIHFDWNETKDWTYESAIWIFFGRNPIGNVNLEGRPDHTDAVSNDGTWHYQLSGTKRWFLRPSSELLSRSSQKTGTYHNHTKLQENMSYVVECKVGDVIIINTRLWFHQTEIPPHQNPSISYARDFRMQETKEEMQIECGMTNIDGLYATEFISTDTVIFTEANMPDCELHVSKTPNCKVVDLDDGSRAVVSIRNISAGEFFCVEESSSDSESNGDDDSEQTE